MYPTTLPTKIIRTPRKSQSWNIEQNFYLTKKLIFFLNNAGYSASVYNNVKFRSIYSVYRNIFLIHCDKVGNFHS